MGLLFLGPSLRTRVGFASAAAALGWVSVEIERMRPTGGEHVESFEDTLRVASGLCDLIVVRPARPITGDRLPDVVAPVINGGDEGIAAEHPSQALVDLFAIERLRGPLGGLHVAIVGDPGTRVARSLLSLFVRRPPAHLTVVTRSHLAARVRDRIPDGGVVWEDLSAAATADVVYVTGMPHGSMPAENRARLVVDEVMMSGLNPEAVVLSPMPVLDEIASEVRNDPRMRYHLQSDLGRFVRIALLELMGTS